MSTNPPDDHHPGLAEVHPDARFQVGGHRAAVFDGMREIRRVDDEIDAESEPDAGDALNRFITEREGRRIDVSIAAYQTIHRVDGKSMRERAREIGVSAQAILNEIHRISERLGIEHVVQGALHRARVAARTKASWAKTKAGKAAEEAFAAWKTADAASDKHAARDAKEAFCRAADRLKQLKGAKTRPLSWPQKKADTA
jgi:hypothetical protein